MGILLSRCIGLVTPSMGAAAQFYVHHFGMVDLDPASGVELAAGPLRLFLDPGQNRPVVFELTTDDHHEARHLVRQFGFEELVWRGQGQSCLVRDPFGLVFNIHEDRTASFPQTLEEPDPGFIKPCVGAVTPSPDATATFYARVLDSVPSRLPDGSYVVDSGPIRIRFRSGPETRPVIWIRSDAPLDQLQEAGCFQSHDDVLIDPFGVTWSIENVAPAPRAVCCPL